MKPEEKVVWAELTKTDDTFDAFRKYYGKGGFKKKKSK